MEAVPDPLQAGPTRVPKAESRHFIRGIVLFQFVGSLHLSCWIVSFAGRSMGAIIPQLLCTPSK